MANKPSAKKKAPARSGAKNAAPAKGGAKAAAKTKAKETKAPHAVVEIVGIILIALGALFAVYLYSGNDDWLGRIISTYLLGMHGVFAYAVPVLFVIIGFYLIIGGRKKPACGTLLTGLLAVLFILCALHMWTSRELVKLSPLGTNGMGFTDYVSQFFGQFPKAWTEGVQAHAGGGVLGMIIPTLLYVIGGKLLCWVVIIAGFLISVLLCTGISIKAYTDAFGSKVREKIAEHEQSLTEDYDEEEAVEPARRPWKKDFQTTIDDAAPVRRKIEPHKKSKLSFDELFEVPEATRCSPQTRRTSWS